MIFTLLKRLWNYLRLKAAIKQADKMKELTKKRYYVIKILKKIRVYDRNHIDFLINEGLLHQKLRKAIELEKVCLYFTK
ncbi:MAG: hypothetical protein JEY96_16925 [Bacteroidales bacterium]|nr:hypothetical protein [Bacteroidales bacterium]